MIDLVFYVGAVLLATASLCYTSPPDKKSAINSTSSKEHEYRVKYAAQMLSYMNRSVNPCDDFYEYSCGNWKNVIDEHLITHKRNNILETEYKLNDIVETILHMPNINEVAPEYAEEFELAKNFYRNCLEAELYPMRASAEYLAVLKEIGGFPAVETNWNRKKFNWLNMSAHLSNYGINSLIHEKSIDEYPFSPQFKIPTFGFDFKLNSRDITDRSSYEYLSNKKRMLDILTMYGVEKSRINGIIADIFKFIKKILKVTESFGENEQMCEYLQLSMAPSKVKALARKWRVYEEIAWSGKKLNYYSPCYYLHKKLNIISMKNKAAAANYLSLKFLFHIDARLKDTKYQKDYCILKVKNSMNFFLDHLYMKLYFNNELREEISGIVKEIRKSLRSALQNANWLDGTTRKAALLKESKIKEYVGRYENETMTKLLIGELKKLKFVEGNYEKNNLNLLKFRKHMKRFSGLNSEKLGNNKKPLAVLVGMQSNSFYNALDNSIYIMAGILMEPVYNKAWPNSLKFAALGPLIGHEFTHGFDSMGAHFDEAGNRKYWLSNNSKTLFKKLSNCYIYHYKSFIIQELNRTIDGSLALDENIADFSGLNEALLAYRRYMKDITKELDTESALHKAEQMPGIDLMPEQLFFLGFAQLWCATYNIGDYYVGLRSEHAIDKYRAIGPLTNNVDFAKAYNCPVGSKMNPSPRKCAIWKS